MAVTSSTHMAVRSAFRLWRTIFDGRPFELREREVGVVAVGSRPHLCTADAWQRIGGYFTDSDGWLPPSSIREHLTDWITNEAGGATEDEVCALVDLGLELSESALRAWHRAGFAAPTDADRRKKLDSKLNSQRDKVFRRIARGFSPRPPAARPGVYRYPPGKPKDWAEQLHVLVETVRRRPLQDSLRDQAAVLRQYRPAWRDDLPSNPWPRDLRSLVSEGALIAVHDRLACYLHVLHGPSRSDGGRYALTRFDRQAAAEPKHEQMLRVGGQMLEAWFDACPQRADDGPDREDRTSDAVLAVRLRRLRGTAAAGDSRNYWCKAQVLVDLAVADVIGTALDGWPDGAVSRWLTAGCLDAIVARVQARADRAGPLDSVGVPPGNRNFEIQFDEQLVCYVEAIVDRAFFDEHGSLRHKSEREDGSVR